jgi:hypothetical protein
MKSSQMLVKWSLSIACLLLYNAVVFAQDPELVRRFDYDAKAPLDLKIISSQKRGDVTVPGYNLRQSERWRRACISRRAG